VAQVNTLIYEQYNSYGSFFGYLVEAETSFSNFNYNISWNFLRENPAIIIKSTKQRMVIMVETKLD